MTARIDRDAVARELTDTLDRIDAEEERAREAAKRAKERIGGMKDKARELRDVLAGRRGVQLPIAAAVLAEAGEVAERKAATMCACGVMTDWDNPGCHHHGERARSRRKDRAGEGAP